MPTFKVRVTLYHKFMVEAEDYDDARVVAAEEVLWDDHFTHMDMDLEITEEAD